jgi:hypothetical protein
MEEGHADRAFRRARRWRPARRAAGADAEHPTSNRAICARSRRSPASRSGERSRALFGEIAKVVTHPRCMNCHPAGDHPLQGDDQHEHMPPVPRGEAGLGVAGLSCSACHTERNFTLVGTGATTRAFPGHPRWQLAPLEMAWEGKSVSQICQQIKDPNRNGGRTLALLHEHLAQGRSGRVGLVAGRRPRGGTGNAGAARRACAGVDRERGGVSELKTSS